MHIGLRLGISSIGSIVPFVGGSFTDIASNNAADGIYTLNGAPCTIEDILDLSSANTLFDPATDIDSGGMRTRVLTPGSQWQGTSFDLQPSLAADLLAAGFTLVLEMYMSGVSDEVSTIEIDFHNTDFSAYSYLFLRCWPSNVELTITDLDPLNNDPAFEFVSHGNDTDPYVVTSGAVNKAAVTVTDQRMAISLNGMAVQLVEAPGLDGTQSNIYFGIDGKDGVRLRSFTFYAPVQDSDLPSLSSL